jgi:hypothetical protein
MSDLIGVIAISSLVILGSFFGLWTVRMAHDLAVQIITGVVQGTPLSLGTRAGILYNMWFPAAVFGAAVLAFLALAELEIAKHVNGAGVELLAQLAAFMAACGSVFVLSSALFALFRYRAKLRRDKLRQAEAD